MSCDLLIRSYWKDFDWLLLCLESVGRFCDGFRAVILVLPLSSREAFARIRLPIPAAVVFCRDYRDDYLGQQVTKLRADELTDADLICHVDSDCVFEAPFTPDAMMTNGLPRIIRAPGAALARHYPWRAPTEAFLGWTVEDDFMQRPPFLYPRWLYAEVRAHAVAAHGVDIETYVESRPPRGFSEFNTLGAFAWARHRHRFAWVDAADAGASRPPCRWYWSWGGLDRDTRRDIRRLLDGPPPCDA